MSLSILYRFEVRRRRRQLIAMIPLQRLRDRDNPLENYNAFEFKKRYHLFKETAVFIISLLEPELERPFRKGVHLPPAIQFLAVLKFYASGSFQLDNADRHNLCQATISNLILRISVAIAKHSKRFIHYPTATEAIEIRQRFYTLYGFPGIVGAIDGTHVHIKSPGGDNAELFRNRKGRFSINVQAVCDDTLQFRDLVARWYGSAHDSRIFGDSELSDNLEDGIYPGNLLGDGGYSQLPYLMTPFEPPSTPAEERYNKSQIKARNTVERAFGVLKTRFPCLKKLRLKLDTCLVVIVAVFIVYNIARGRKDIFRNDRVPKDNDDYLVDEETRKEAQRNSAVLGTVARSAIVKSHFS